MDFSMSADQASLRDLAREVFRDRGAPELLAKAEAEGAFFDAHGWSALVRTELLGVAIPASYGGADLGFFELCLVLEQQGAHVVPVPLFATAVLGALPITHFGAESLKARWLPQVAQGKAVLTAALAEVRNDTPERPDTRAHATADGRWRLTGEKVSVSAGMRAELMLVSATCDDGSARLFAVETDAPGVRRVQQVTSNGEPLAQVVFDGVEVDAAAALPPEALPFLLEHARVAQCALALGLCERAMRLTAKYTTERQQFERPIATFQAVAHRAADQYVDVETLRLAFLRAAWQLSAGRDARTDAAVARIFAANALHRVLTAAQHLHGGMGFDRDYPLYRYYLWGKCLETSLGSAASETARLGRMLADAVPRA
ncbi:MAG: acyl-CoA dehydrogenase family protein [Bradymonadia bacterium]